MTPHARKSSYQNSTKAKVRKAHLHVLNFSSKNPTRFQRATTKIFLPFEGGALMGFSKSAISETVRHDEKGYWQATCLGIHFVPSQPDACLGAVAPSDPFCPCGIVCHANKKAEIFRRKSTTHHVKSWLIRPSLSCPGQGSRSAKPTRSALDLDAPKRNFLPKISHGELCGCHQNPAPIEADFGEIL